MPELLNVFLYVYKYEFYVALPYTISLPFLILFLHSDKDMPIYRCVC